MYGQCTWCACVSIGQIGAGRKQGWPSRRPLTSAVEEQGVEAGSRGRAVGSRSRKAEPPGDRVRARGAWQRVLRGHCVVDRL